MGPELHHLLCLTFHGPDHLLLLAAQALQPRDLRLELGASGRLAGRLLGREGRPRLGLGQQPLPVRGQPPLARLAAPHHRQLVLRALPRRLRLLQLVARPRELTAQRQHLLVIESQFKLLHTIRENMTDQYFFYERVNKYLEKIGLNFRSYLFIFLI